MHYSNLVIVEKQEGRDVKAAVDEAMKYGKGLWWDFYMIGGRWTGLFDGYDPESDQALLQTCWLCHGTGVRPDMQVKDGCNGCAGTGKERRWPTQWPFRESDVIPVEALTAEHLGRAYRVVCEGYYREFGGEEYLPWKESGQCFVRREKPPLEWLHKQFAGHLVAIVDNHN